MSTIPRFTVAEFDRMIESGVFDSRRERRIELIYGELREMSPPGPTHEDLIDWLARWSIENTNKAEVRVRVQNPIELPDLDSAPQPDIAWVKAKSYRDNRPLAADVLLVIEVSNSSLDYDQREKARLYAEAGIKDYWIVNVPFWRVDVYREPAGETFQSITRYDQAARVSPLAFPEIQLSVRELFHV